MKVKSAGTVGGKFVYCRFHVVMSSVVFFTEVLSGVKGTVSRNSAKLGNYKMPVKLRET